MLRRYRAGPAGGASSGTRPAAQHGFGEKSAAPEAWASGAALGAGVQVASRRVARGGSSRTVFRDGLLVRPGDTGHTDTRLNSVPALTLPAEPVTAITAEPAPGPVAPGCRTQVGVLPRWFSVGPGTTAKAS